MQSNTITISQKNKKHQNLLEGSVMKQLFRAGMFRLSVPGVRHSWAPADV